MLSKQVVRMLMVVTVLSIGFLGSGFGSVALADELEDVDALVEEADALIEYSDALIEAADSTVESADAAIETVDLMVEDALAAFDLGETDFCVLIMGNADAAIEALASEPAIPGPGEILGIVGGADLLVEAVDGVVEDALAKLGDAQTTLDPLRPGQGVLGRAIRAVDNAYAATDLADDLVEDADVAVEDAIAAIQLADTAVEDAADCLSRSDLVDADTAVELADVAVEDADVAVEDADAAIELADRKIERADRLIEAAI